MVTQLGVLVRDPGLENMVLHRRSVQPPYGWRPATRFWPEDDSVSAPDDSAYEVVHELFGIEVLNLSCFFRGQAGSDDWLVYSAELACGSGSGSAAIKVDGGKTEAYAWLTIDIMHQLALRTREYLSHRLTREEWEDNPGLEPAWCAAHDEMSRKGLLRYGVNLCGPATGS